MKQVTKTIKHDTEKFRLRCDHQNSTIGIMFFLAGLCAAAVAHRTFSTHEILPAFRARDNISPDHFGIQPTETNKTPNTSNAMAGGKGRLKPTINRLINS